MLHFEGDDIANNEAEAKRMRKSKKETEKKPLVQFVEMRVMQRLRRMVVPLMFHK